MEAVKTSRGNSFWTIAATLNIFFYCDFCRVLYLQSARVRGRSVSIAERPEEQGKSERK